MGGSTNQMINRQRTQIEKLRQDRAAKAAEIAEKDATIERLSQENNALQAEFDTHCAVIEKLQGLLATQSKPSWITRLRGLLCG